jgi:PBP1b-binding outer membrane lipoprotein LpoB
MKRIILLMIMFTLFLSGCSKSAKPTNNEPKKEYVKNVSELVEKLKLANLSVVNPKNMESSDFGMAPNVSDEAMIFEVESEMNARVFKVSKSEDLNLLKSYYVDLGKSSTMFFSHTYSKGVYLIQMNGEISKETFDKYVVVIDEFVE